MSDPDDRWPERGRQTAAGREGPPVATLVTIVVIVAAAVIFVAQNRDRTRFNFLFVHTNSRTWVLLLLAFALGVLVGFLARTAVRRRRR